MHLQGMLILLRPVFLSQDFTCLDPKLPKNIMEHHANEKLAWNSIIDIVC